MEPQYVNKGAGRKEGRADSFVQSEGGKGRGGCPSIVRCRGSVPGVLPAGTALPARPAEAPARPARPCRCRRVGRGGAGRSSPVPSGPCSELGGAAPSGGRPPGGRGELCEGAAGRRRPPGAAPAGRELSPSPAGRVRGGDLGGRSCAAAVGGSAGSASLRRAQGWSSGSSVRLSLGWGRRSNCGVVGSERTGGCTFAQGSQRCCNVSLESVEIKSVGVCAPCFDRGLVSALPPDFRRALPVMRGLIYWPQRPLLF